jgi:exopolyphosphatase
MKVCEFVKKSKTLFENLTKVSVAIGNQSADLDSIVSAICYSYYVWSNSQKVCIPIINSNPSVLKTKKECIFMLEKLSINLDDFVYITDWNKSKIAEVILVDHNELDEHTHSLNLEHLVTGIVDHHLDKGLFTSASPRIINTSIGSNTTQIAEMIFKSNIDFDESFATMMLMPILSDTSNLSCRASQKDFKMVEYLSQFVDFDPVDMYKQIEELKFNNQDLEETPILLKKDYKQYELKSKSWGMSSVTFYIRDWIETGDHLNEVIEFMNEKKLYFFAVLSCYKHENEFKRDLALLGSKELMNLFDRFSSEDLNFGKVIENEKFAVRLYDVTELSLTRKYWQPVLEEFLKSI